MVQYSIPGKSGVGNELWRKIVEFLLLIHGKWEQRVVTGDGIPFEIYLTKGPT